MKQFFTLLLLALGSWLQAQTIYVKAGSLGNGASWQTAYGALDVALAAAQPGQAIWVAAGTYKPQQAAPNNTFLLQTGVSLYGGFAGTETALSQRNIAANPTILNGDIAGDDIAGNFDQNRIDNVPHVVTIYAGGGSGTATPAVLDGFTVQGGHTLVAAPNPDLSRRGGGALVGARATIRNCSFNNNFGESGAAVAALDAASDGFVADNCVFENNRATEQAILYLRQTPTAEINKCIFRNNKTNRGTFYPRESSSLQIDSCLFEGNDAGANFGGAMYSWQSTWTMTNCIFRKNKANNAAGIYIDNRDGGDLVTLNNCLFELDTTAGFGGSGIYGWQATAAVKNCTFRDNYAPNAAAMYFNGREFDSQFSIDSCLFERNITSGYGGTCIYHNRTNYTLSNSIFRNNTAPSSGAALYHGDTTVFTIKNCLFESNRGNFAAAIANYGIGCNGTFDGCTFMTNVANSGGGAVSNGFKADVLYKNCLFSGNEASYGGAIFTQNDTTRLRIDGSTFEGNITTGSGGCVYVNSNIAASIRNSNFYYNTGNFGGVLQAFGDSLLRIENCIFRDNFANTQGGALNLNQVNAEITNCLFARNTNLGTGAGGAISINAADSLQSRVKAINCTFADNVAEIGAGIAQWEAPEGDAKMWLLNCLLQNDAGLNYAIEEGEPEVFSLNGNQSSDGSLEDYLIGNKDANSLSVSFADPGNDDYRLSGGEPVDGGVADGAPVTDLLGNPRVGLPDRGCYEFGTSKAKSPEFQMLSLQCAPNPGTEYTRLSLQNKLRGALEISVWNQAGQRVFYLQSEKTADDFGYTLDLHKLPTGAYLVQCGIGKVLHEGLLLKQ